MSLFGRFVGQSKKKKDGGDAKSKSDSKKSHSPKEALVKLRETEDMLTKKSEYLEKKIKDSTDLAKNHAAKKNKRSAIQALKRKKMYEKHQKQVDETLFSIEYQRIALENANTNTEVIKVLGDASKAMKKAQKNVSIDEVNKMMDDMAEQREFSNEIQEAISQPVGMSEFDDDELWAEFEAESAPPPVTVHDDKKMRPTSFKLPAVPGHDVEAATLPPRLKPTPSTSHYKKKAPKPKSKSIEDDEIEKLAAWAS